MSPKKRLIIIISIIVSVFVVIPLLIFISVTLQKKSQSDTSHTVIIDNLGSYSNGIPINVFIGIEQTAYTVTIANTASKDSVLHGIIRANSFKYSPSNSVSFLLDIPSLKVSWSVAQAIDGSNTPLSGPLIQCVANDQAIYPLLKNCNDGSSGSLTQQQQQFVDTIVKDLPLTGFTYSIDYNNSPDKQGTYALFVTYYTNQGKQDALDALTSLGYNPSDYEIIYIDSTKPAS